MGGIVLLVRFAMKEGGSRSARIPKRRERRARVKAGDKKRGEKRKKKAKPLGEKGLYVLNL